MKNNTVRKPFFEIGVKNYVYGDAVLSAALAADKAAAEYDIDVMMIVPYTEIRRVAEHTDRLIVLAPYMDLLYPGRGMAAILPEAIKAAGAAGVVINHCEKPLSMREIELRIDRARELSLMSFVCCGSLEEAREIAGFSPEFINPEPMDCIGHPSGGPTDFVAQTNRAVHAVNPDILVEQAAGISTPRHVYEFIMAGADGVGVASGIFKSADPEKMIVDMVAAVRRACDDLKGE